jgi:hypothetical protein
VIASVVPITTFRESTMGNARTKLNVAYFNGSLLVASLFGLVAGSWAVFMAALAVLIACGVYGGEIRPVSVRR